MDFAAKPGQDIVISCTPRDADGNPQPIDAAVGCELVSLSVVDLVTEVPFPAGYSQFPGTFQVFAADGSQRDSLATESLLVCPSTPDTTDPNVPAIAVKQRADADTTELGVVLITSQAFTGGVVPQLAVVLESSINAQRKQ